jgi:hypothetical protein
MLACHRKQTAVQAFLAVLIVCGACRAEERSVVLPKDGSWVRCEFEVIAPPTKLASTVTLSIVGSAVENETRCRWVEVKSVFPKGQIPRFPDGGTFLTKMLISEQDLLENADPSKRSQRAWVRKPGEPQAEQTKVLPVSKNLMLWAPGVRRTLTETTDEKSIDYQSGQLKSARAWTGTQTVENQDRKSQFKSTYTVWMHPDLPMGFAEAEIVNDITYTNGDAPHQQRHVFRIIDAGNDAKSELPDNN